MEFSVAEYFSVIRQVITAPKIFFEGLSETEGYKKSVIFLIINTFLTLFLTSLFSFLFSLKFTQFIYGVAAIAVISPFILLLFFAVTAVLHIIAKMLGGKGKFVNSFQVLAYSSAVSPLTAIPLIGFIASIYQFYITITGFRKFHQYSTVKATINILLPIVLIMIIVGIFIALAGSALFNYLKESGLKPADLKNQPNIENVNDLKKVYPSLTPTITVKYEEDSTNYSYPTGYDDYQENDYTE